MGDAYRYHMGGAHGHHMGGALIPPVSLSPACTVAQEGPRRLLVTVRDTARLADLLSLASSPGGLVLQVVGAPPSAGGQTGVLRLDEILLMEPGGGGALGSDADLLGRAPGGFKASDTLVAEQRPLPGICVLTAVQGHRGEASLSESLNGKNWGEIP